MAEETTAQFLNRREKELLAQISALRGQLGPKEAELAQITRMKASLTILGGNTSPRNALLVESPKDPPGGPLALWDTNLLGPIADSLVNVDSQYSKMSKEVAARIAAMLNAQPSTAQAFYAAMTIKEVVIQALLDHFPNGGTAAEIRDFIRNAYGRVVAPSSLRPQMHRLKADSILEHDPSTDTWNLNSRKRQLYATYDHPTSRRAMKELQDDPSTEE